MDIIIGATYADSDDKYITFKRDEFYQFLGKHALPPWRDENGELIGVKVDAAGTTAALQEDLGQIELEDAVVIRRRDLFASPALASYAAAIVMAIKLAPNAENREELLRVADYFQRQSELAAEEGHQMPTI
jgi:hypothetical protein